MKRVKGLAAYKLTLTISPEVASALRRLHETGLFGDGSGSEDAVAEELLRRALLDPQIVPFWRKQWTR
jgi:hypothetical protein